VARRRGLLGLSSSHGYRAALSGGNGASASTQGQIGFDWYLAALTNDGGSTFLNYASAYWTD